MATTSFTKEIILNKSEEIERFMDIWCDRSPFFFSMRIRGLRLSVKIRTSIFK
ncbi:MAG: hypothetical protein FWD34_09865 [Oscillospiraceae bacterium]|nr:hypothetical protein [Oscillospiraceae bacterium]